MLIYQTIPTNEVIKDAMFDYMRTKNGNIIAVVDKKKESIVQYLKQYQKEFRSSLSKKTEVCLRKVCWWKGKWIM
jgi:ABC-type branched-subunit amino acid transport system substrate-binding protein